jgi:CDP-glycerol glycerophosphotransferase (TagB/SpsB family)
MLVPALIVRKSKKHWVIGGHRGRLYSDNSAALHQFVVQNTNTEIYWIASASLKDQLKPNFIVLRKHSFKARWIILTAPVLIYSHGEDDLELFLVLFRWCLGHRFHLNHCMNHLKAGDLYRRDYEESGFFKKKLLEFLVTDFDWLLASSELEKSFFEKSIPHKKERIITGGGAHIDAFINNSSAKTKSEILWFPTFRDSRAGVKHFEEIMYQVVNNTTLIEWLKQKNYKLIICSHINSSLKHTPSGDQIVILGPSQILTAMFECELFISDYSGLQLDYMLLNKPIIHFLFDLEEYLQKRRLYLPYNEFAFGPIIKKTEALIDYICSESWRNQSEWALKKEERMGLIFPTKEPVYAKNTYQTILKLSQI